MTISKKEFAPMTPGAMLKEEFLAEYGLSINWQKLSAASPEVPPSSVDLAADFAPTTT
jgi:plasmid maintenance system antidote protein VapI